MHCSRFTLDLHCNRVVANLRNIRFDEGLYIRYFLFDEVGEDGLGGDVRLCGVLLAAADGVDDAESGVLVGLEGGLAGGAVVDGGVDGAIQLHKAVAEVRHAVRRFGSAV